MNFIIVGIFLLLLSQFNFVFPQKSMINFHNAEAFISNFDSDYSVQNSSISTLYGFQLKMGIMSSRSTEIQIDLGLIEYPNNLSLFKFAISPFYRNKNILIGASYSYAWLEKLTSHSISANIESYESDLLSAVGSLNYEFYNLGGDQFAAELFLLIYPSDYFMISSGASLAQNDFKQTDIDVIVRIEWLPPLFEKNNFSMYGQWGGNYIQQTSFGIKLYFGLYKSLKTNHRQNGFYSSRFK